MGRANALAVCIKSRIAPELRVVSGGLRTGCSGYQERVAQNRQCLVGAATGSRTAPKSGWPRTPTLYTTQVDLNNLKKAIFPKIIDLNKINLYFKVQCIYLAHNLYYNYP